jgi:hypothetical protein
LFGSGGGRKGRKIVDRHVLHAHVTRDRVQTRAMASRTDLRFIFFDPFRFTFGGKLVFEDGFAILAFAELQRLVPNFAEAAAFLASTVRRIE